MYFPNNLKWALNCHLIISFNQFRISKNESPAAPVKKRYSYTRSARFDVGLAMLRPQPPSKKTKVTNASTVIEETHRSGDDGGTVQSEDEIRSKVPVESVPSFYSNEVYFKLSKANSKMYVAKTWPFTYL